METDFLNRLYTPYARVSALQLESVLYAGQQHAIVRNGKRLGFFLGDGTGVGKGRQVS